MAESSRCSTVAERGEIDTSLPFQSVKAALSMFGEKTNVNKSQSVEQPILQAAVVRQLEEQVIAGRHRLSAAEDAKTKTYEESRDPTQHLETVTESCGELCGSKQLRVGRISSILNGQETIDSSRPKASFSQQSSHEHLHFHDAEPNEESTLAKGRDRKNSFLDETDPDKKNIQILKQRNSKVDGKHVVQEMELKAAQEQHRNAVAELELVKKDLERMREELAVSLKEKENALQQTEEALITAELNAKRVEDLSHEMSGTNESLVLVKLACMEANKDRAALLAANGATNPHLLDTTEQSMMIVEQLETKIALASQELIRLQEELGLAKEAEMRVASAASEAYKDLALAKAELEKTRMQTCFTMGSSCADSKMVRHELDKALENGELLQSNLVTLQSELESMKEELADLRDREAIARAAVGTLTAELARTKEDLTCAMTAEIKANEAMKALEQTLQNSRTEADEAKATVDALRGEAAKARVDAEHAKSALASAEQELKVAIEATEAAKAAESDALERLTTLLDIFSEMHSSGAEGGAGTSISHEEYEQLKRKMHEAEELANSKIAAATEQAEAVKMREIELQQKMLGLSDDINAMKSNTKQALHRAEAAEVAKLTMESELRRWRQSGKGHESELVTINLKKHDERGWEPTPRVKLQRVGKELGNPPSRLVGGGSHNQVLSYNYSQSAESSLAQILNIKMPSLPSEACILSDRFLGQKKKKHYILPSFSIFAKKNQSQAGSVVEF